MRKAESLAAIIEQVMKDATIGEKARNRSRQFSRERMSRETLAVYEKVLPC